MVFSFTKKFVKIVRNTKWGKLKIYYLEILTHTQKRNIIIYIDGIEDLKLDEEKIFFTKGVEVNEKNISFIYL